MKKIVKSVKQVVASEVQPASTESTPVVAPSPAPVATTPSVVTTMTDPAVQECSTLLDQVVSKLGDHDPLSADEIRRATKMRKGGAEVIPKILALCQQHGVTQIGSLTTAEMADQLKRGDALVQVGLRGAVVQKKIKDSAMGAHGRSWQIGMTMYTTLQRMAVDDPELALGLQPIESFFQTKKTKGLVRKNKKARAAKKVAMGATPVAPEPAAPAPVVAAEGNGVAPAAPAPVATPATAAAVNGAGH